MADNMSVTVLRSSERIMIESGVKAILLVSWLASEENSRPTDKIFLRST